MTSLSKIAKKHLGQNFLIDDNVKERMIDSINISEKDVILEIGPGLGALTEKFLERGATVYAIEKDTTLIPKLKESLQYDNLRWRAT